MAAPFSTPEDIVNRALQRIGSERIAAGTLFTGTTKRHAEAAACYNQLRLTEQRRNVWRFAIRTAVLRPIDSTTLQLVPAAYSSTNRYIVGSVVSYSGLVYIGIDPANIGNTPSSSPTKWMQYFGPMTVTEYDDTLSYFAGELIYTPSTSAYSVYLSLSNANEDVPTTIPAYDATVTYNRGQTVVYTAVNYQSNIDLNIANTPVTLSAWAIGTTYAAAAVVIGTNNHKYTSVNNGNVGHDPVADTAGTYWTDNGPAKWIVIPAIQPDQMQGLNWLKLDATVQSIILLYPPNCGPLDQAASKNVYQLPNGYIRTAPQDPKAGSSNPLGSPTNRQYDDWNFQDNYIVTMEAAPIVFRFAADVADVSKFDPMFCEGLACRIAFELNEPMNQSAPKQAAIGAAYKLFMQEARAVNAIEVGAEEPPLDDYIACRA